MEESPGFALSHMLRMTPSMISERTKAARSILLPPQPEGYDNANPKYGAFAAAFQPDETGMPFYAQAIIANPPVYTHIHLAERLRIPCHIVFTMPWTATKSVGHPLAWNNTDGSRANYYNEQTYKWVESVPSDAANLIGISQFSKDQTKASLKHYEAVVRVQLVL